MILRWYVIKSEYFFQIGFQGILSDIIKNSMTRVYRIPFSLRWGVLRSPFVSLFAILLTYPLMVLLDFWVEREQTPLLGTPRPDDWLAAHISFLVHQLLSILDITIKQIMDWHYCVIYLNVLLMGEGFMGGGVPVLSKLDYPRIFRWVEAGFRGTPKGGVRPPP